MAMAAEPKSDPHLEIAHVLFIDVVGYSKLLMNEQSEVLQQLNQIVRNTEQFRKAEAAGKLIRIPVGDGMALVFFDSPETPVRAAVEISEALQNYPQIQLRMGIHSGPVNEELDVNDRSNVAGAGINMAQRVMECGDAGHILLSKRVADDLAPFGHWRSQLHDLGDCEVKHGESVFLVNFYNDKIGNRQLPQKLKRARQIPAGSAVADSVPAIRKQRPVPLVAFVLAGLAVALVILFFVYRTGSKQSISTSPGAAAGISIPEKSIAVLPFENLSKDEENAFFAGGVQDEILTNLAKIADLKVISRTSVMKYKSGPERNLREIAKALGVAHILEGSVQRAAARVRVSAQLIDARSDTHLWADHYDRDIADVFAIQSEIAQQIADQLRAKLSPEEKARVEAKPTNNPDAYLSYLQAREHDARSDLQGSEEDVEAAQQFYRKAISLDPSFALAHARLSIRCSNWRRTEANKSKAQLEAGEALRLRPDLGETHLALGLIYLNDANYDRALAELEIARRALPNDSEVLSSIAMLHQAQGRWSDSIAEYEQAFALDPRNGATAEAVTSTYCEMRNWSAAKEASERMIAIAPEAAILQSVHAYIDFWSRGDITRAKAFAQDLPTNGGDTPIRAWARWDINLVERNFAAAEQAVDSCAFDPLPIGSAPPAPKSYLRGCIKLAQGETARALSEFEAARPTFEGYVREGPQGALRHSSLGMLYAFMGRKEDAIREGLRAAELAPESKDAATGPKAAAQLALIYARTGEADKAVALIEHLLSTPSCLNFDLTITQADLRLRWHWDPLRKDPRFQKLVTGPEPKTVYR
jgi:TolB-like protein/Flp pilus assembly protein TadD